MSYSGIGQLRMSNLTLLLQAVLKCTEQAGQIDFAAGRTMAPSSSIRGRLCTSAHSCEPTPDPLALTLTKLRYNM